MGLCSALRVSASASASRCELPLLSMILEFKEIYFLYSIVLRRKPAPHLVFDQRNTNLSLLGQKKNVVFPTGCFQRWCVGFQRGTKIPPHKQYPEANFRDFKEKC